MICYLQQSISQDRQINGFVRDASTKEAMAFVNIAVVGSTYGTVSNQNGEFTINLKQTGETDSIAFHFIGYRTYLTKIDKLGKAIVIEMQEEKIKIQEITILAKPVTAEELINNALYRTGINYPQIPQRMEVFKRRNSASYIDNFDLSLVKSDIIDIDKSFIETVVDSMPRYTRSYSDHLYTLYSEQDEDIRVKTKIVGIKSVVLKEDDGGNMEQVEKIMINTLNRQEGDRTFWKLKTGILSLKVDEGDPDKQSTDTSSMDQEKLDSVQRINPRGLYTLIRNDYVNWNWDFFRKPEQYKYEITGIVPIEDEYAYQIRFEGRLRGDYHGIIYISDETYAILRIIRFRKKRLNVKGFKLLGISYSEPDDSGLLIYTKDEHGYYLKYAMNNKVSEADINRVFSMIKKQKRPIIRKKLNEVKIDLNMSSRLLVCSMYLS